MTKAERSVIATDLYVAIQSARFMHGGAEIVVWPGLLVRQNNPVRLARPGLFDLLVLELGYENPGLEPSETTVVVCGERGLGHGAEMIRVRRYRTRPADDELSA